MIVLSSERPHDQGVKHSMANDRWNDAPAFPAAQTVDNASNDRQCQIDSAASVGNRKYGRHEEQDENLISLVSIARFRPTKRNPLYIRPRKNSSSVIGEMSTDHSTFPAGTLSIDRQTPVQFTHTQNSAKRAIAANVAD